MGYGWIHRRKEGWMYYRLIFSSYIMYNYSTVLST